MKIVFEGESLNDIHKQIILAAKEVQTTSVVSFDTQSTWKDQPEVDTHSGARLDVPPAMPILNAFPNVDWAKPGAYKTVEQELPVQGAPTTKQDRIDGYVVSDGKVWVPVEGRSSAYTGVEVDEYHRRKNAAVELDSEGKAWDASIHASTKTKTVKGVWKKKKQFGDKEETVEQAQPAQAVAAPQEMPQFEQSSAPIGRAPEMHNYESFKKNLQMILVRLHTAGKIDRPYMAELTKWAEVTNLWEVTKNEEKTKQLFDLFVQNQYIIGV